jgi:hypothetical protein
VAGAVRLDGCIGQICCFVVSIKFCRPDVDDFATFLLQFIALSFLFLAELAANIY